MKEKSQQSFLTSVLIVVLFVVAIFVLVDYVDRHGIEIGQDEISVSDKNNNQVFESQTASTPGGIFILTGEEE